MLPVDEQMKVIASGTAAIVPEEDLRKKLAQDRPLIVKLGVDPTAPDLHLGHAVPLRKLRQFQELGHKVVLIIGDYTALIGDPSGRSATRPALTIEQINENADTYVTQAFKILDADKTVLRRNSEWLAPLQLKDVLWLTSQFTVARILERDDFQNRYRSGQAISLHEFLYPVMQAYDSVELREHVEEAPNGADIEIGGTDQLFNLLAGRELMEKLGMEPQVCLTLPLLEGTDGVQKMSKSYGNYVGLTDAPEDMFGKVMSIPDDLMDKYFRLATSMAVDRIDEIESALRDGSMHPAEAKRTLAGEIVGEYHGDEAARQAEEAFDRVFRRREMPEDVPEHHMAAAESVHLPALLEEAGLASTRSDARRLIDGGGVKIDGQSVQPGGYDVAWDEISGKVLQVGKRKFVRLLSD